MERDNESAQSAAGLSSNAHRAQFDMADAETPLITECWYVAARSDEVGAALMDRWLLGRDILLYRGLEGTPIALDNRCPHRSFPLSKGRRDGDRISCGYHGMTFDRDGRCVRAPAGAPGRSSIGVRAYPVVERAPLIWIWMGDPNAAQPSDIPDYFPLHAPQWDTLQGYVEVAANYVGLHENLQDLSHFEHLHRASIGIPDQSTAEVDLKVTEDAIRTTLVYADVLVPPLWSKVIPQVSNRVTRTIREAFKSPALCDAHTTITDLRSPATGTRDFDTRIYHFITPESQHKTHYWWFFMRNFALQSSDVSAALQRGIAQAFEEDRQALEWISELARRERDPSFRELSFRTDKSGVLMRRRLRALAEKNSPSA